MPKQIDLFSRVAGFVAATTTMRASRYCGRTLEGRYKVLKLLDEGSMGAVYLGRHVRIGRDVAIKILHSILVENDDIVTRFYREAKAATAINHKNIIEVFDVGETEDGDPYLVMEYLEGESLAAMIDRVERLDLAAACGILEPVLEALDAVHSAEIVHRDLKPENIFIVSPPEADAGPPLVKLIDFGISKITREMDQTQLTRTGHVLGTPAYMSPEQARGAREVDHRADIYSVGVILYEMLSGWLPFTADSYQGILDLVISGKPTPPKEAHPGFPDEAIAVVMRALSRDPNDRFGTAPEMLDAIGKFGGFDRRAERLGTIMSAITDKSCATGDLGQPVRDDAARRQMARRALEHLARKDSPRRAARPGPNKRGPLILAVGLLTIAAAAIGIGVAIGRAGDEATEQEDDGASAAGAPATEPAPQAQADVRIEVTGVPAGATIYYDNAPVPENPFRVRAGVAVVPLRVEAPDFAPFAVSVVPSKDQQVEARMVRLEPAASGSRADGGEGSADPPAGNEPPAAKRRPKTKDPGSKGDDKFIKSFE